MEAPTATARAPREIVDAAAEAGSWPDGSAGLRAFLRAEMAASPERWRTTARITLACVLGALAVVVFHRPTGSWVMISILVVSLPNAGATLQKGLERVASTALACGVGLVIAAGVADLPWLRIPLGAAGGGFAIFLSRTTSRPYAMLLGGITFCLLLLGESDGPQAIVDFGLWRTALIAIGVAIVVTIQLFVWPTDPETLLLDDLALRLAAVESVLAGFLEGRADRPGLVSLESLLAGLPREIDLLANAETRHLSARHHHAERLVLITGVERLLTATIELLGRADTLAHVSPSPALTVRFANLVSSVSALRERLTSPEARRPSIEIPGSTLPDLAPDETRIWLASLIELEDAARLTGRALHLSDEGDGESGRRGELPSSPLDVPDAGWRTPAFSFANGADIRIALKATLGLFVFALGMHALRWPGIATGLITIMVVSGTTNGAIAHKALLRICGASFGGLLGIAAILVVIPNATSLPAYLAVVAVGSAAAAWILAGSPRIAYVGIQTGIAFGLCLVDSFGPTINLAPPRDRVVGILLGDLLATFLAYALWPVFAADSMQGALARAVRAVAGLSRLGVHLNASAQVRPAHGFRWQFYQAIAQTLVMIDEAAFEFGGRSSEVTARRATLSRMIPLAQEIFLVELAIARHRIAVDLSGTPFADAIRPYSEAVAHALERIASLLEGRRDVPSAPLAVQLAETRRRVDSLRTTLTNPASDESVVHSVEGRLALQETLAGLIERLDLKARELAPSSTA